MIVIPSAEPGFTHVYVNEGEGDLLRELLRKGCQPCHLSALRERAVMADSKQHSSSEADGARPASYRADSASEDFATIRKVLGSTGCDGLSSKASDEADFALLRLEEQLKLCEQSRNLLTTEVSERFFSSYGAVVSVSAYYDVWCDIDGERCMGWCEGATSSGRKARTEARRIARSLGWMTKRVDGKTLDVCPNCADSEPREQAVSYDREKTQMQETGTVYVAGMSVAAIAQIVSDLGISPFSAWITGRGELVSGVTYGTASASNTDRSPTA